MNFNRHSNLEGQHAFLGASKYHWINYDESKVAESYSKFSQLKKEPFFMNLRRNAFDSVRNYRSLRKH